MPRPPGPWKRNAALRAQSAALCRRAEALRRTLSRPIEARETGATDAARYLALEKALQESRADLRSTLRELEVEDRRLSAALADVERRKAASARRARKGRVLSFKGKREGR